MPLINFEKYNVLMDKSYTSQLGKVAKVVGLTIESIGPSAKLNDLCLIRSNNRTEPVKAEVVGFRDDRVLLSHMMMSKVSDLEAGWKIPEHLCRLQLARNFLAAH